MFKQKEKIDVQRKNLSKTVGALKKYINSRNKGYRKFYEIPDFYRFQDKCFIEISNIFGHSSEYALKIDSLSLPTNREGKVETYCLQNCFGMLLGTMEGCLSALQMQNYKKRFQVFISSTYLDLKNYRQSAYDIITSEGYFPAGMENFMATSVNPEEYIKNVIDDSDYYVLIIGQRYGSIIKDSFISFTEMEYEYAKKKNKVIIPLIYNGSKKLVKDIDNEDALNKFISKVTSENTVSWFKSEEELKLHINQSLNEAIRNHPQAGWIKAKN